MAYSYSAGTTTPNLAGLVEFNGVRINDGTFELHHLGGVIDSAPVRVPLTSLPSDDGGLVGSRFYDPLQINLEARLIVADYTQVGPALDQLRGAFNVAAGMGTLRLNYPGWATARQVTAGVAGPITVDEPSELEKLVPERNFVIPMVAPDPLLYDGDNLRTIDVFINGANVAITNAGTAPTYFTAQFIGPWATSASLIRNTDSATITYVGGATGAQSVTVQTNPTVGISAHNGTGGNSYDAINVWSLYTIPPGTTNFHATAPSGTTAASKVTLTWRDAWY